MTLRTSFATRRRAPPPSSARRPATPKWQRCASRARGGTALAQSQKTTRAHPAPACSSFTCWQKERMNQKLAHKKTRRSAKEKKQTQQSNQSPFFAARAHQCQARRSFSPCNSPKLPHAVHVSKTSATQKALLSLKILKNKQTNQIKQKTNKTNKPNVTK
jgi:hypothetical protein